MCSIYYCMTCVLARCFSFILLTFLCVIYLTGALLVSTFLSKHCIDAFIQSFSWRFEVLNMNSNCKSNWFSLMPSLHFYACVSHKGSSYDRNVEALLKIFSWWLSVKAWASPGLPPAYALDYFAISPHALAESLGDIRASISHTAALVLPPRYHAALPHLLLALQICYCSVYVCFFPPFFLEAN